MTGEKTAVMNDAPSLKAHCTKEAQEEGFGLK